MRIIFSFLFVLRLDTSAGIGIVHQQGNKSTPTSTTCYSQKNIDDLRSSVLTSTTRRTAITNSVKCLTSILTISTSLSTNPSNALASVTVDPDRYGDKELKMATVNVVKGRVRELLINNPQYASPFLQLSMQDALTYNSSTEEGGPDGSIISVVMGPNPPSALVGLIPAAKELVNLQNGLRRTTEITMADVVAMAGAEAIETAGGPRIVVQLGKGEPRSSSKSIAVAGSYPDLSGSGDRAAVINAFKRAGLTERDVALFFGTRIAIEKVVDEIVPVEEEELEVNEMGETEVSFPSSFGGPKEKYGRVIGNLDKSIFVSIIAGLKKKDGKIPNVFNDEIVAGCATTYAKKKADFVKDLRQAYGAWMNLGAKYTGGGILLFDASAGY